MHMSHSKAEAKRDAGELVEFRFASPSDMREVKMYGEMELKGPGERNTNNGW